MSRQQLEEALERLRHELDALDAGAGDAHARLRAVITDVEDQLADLEAGEGDGSLAERIRHQIELFEVEHPRITTILNDIMVTLSNLGI
jgi:hypothetical protein